MSGCQSDPKPKEFSGVMMHVPYRVIVAQELNASQIEKIQKIIIETFHHIDHVYNNWNPSSEISKLSISDQPFLLSKDLYNMLQKVDELYHKSEGRFDVTISPLLKLWKAGKPSAESLTHIQPSIGFSKVHLHDNYCLKDCPEISFDLCGIAKGYAVDLLTQNLCDAGFANVFVDWGGEIKTCGKHSSGRPWKIAIQKQNCIIELDNQAIATSGGEYQFWNIEGTDYLHIIDPRTQTPMTKNPGRIQSVTVIAPTCLLADALATILMLFDSSDEATSWLAIHYPEAKCWISTFTSSSIT